MDDKYKLQITLFRNRNIYGSASCDEVIITHRQKDDVINIDLLDNGVMKLSLCNNERQIVLEKTIVLDTLFYPESEQETKNLENSK